MLLRPLIETFPCLGGVSVSLLNVPHVDCCLELVKGVDLMALPVLPQLIRAAMKVGTGWAGRGRRLEEGEAGVWGLSASGTGVCAVTRLHQCTVAM